MENPADHPVFARNILEFITVANDFCYTIERSQLKSPDTLLVYLQKVLPLLYIKGSLLPAVEVNDPSQKERTVTEEEWQDIFNTIRGKILSLDEFWFPESLDSGSFQPEKLSLSELLADIYQDLKDFVVQYQKTSIFAKENAVMDVREYFYTNWGLKSIKAQLRVHDLLIEKNRGGDYAHLFN